MEKQVTFARLLFVATLSVAITFLVAASIVVVDLDQPASIFTVDLLSTVSVGVALTVAVALVVAVALAVDLGICQMLRSLLLRFLLLLLIQLRPKLGLPLTILLLPPRLLLTWLLLPLGLLPP